jgi:hypothetical protein
MGNPPSHQDFRHTCPTCNRPVRHGDKFCEVCGTRIPSLLTCSKCGTQFIHPKKFCDLCGAPFILEEVPEPDTDEIPEPVIDEIPEPEADEILEPDTGEPEERVAGEIPETDTDEVTEPDEEEIPEPAKEKRPIHYDDEIQEPDTAELLEQFGEEYSDDETLESLRKAKPSSGEQPRAKKAVSGTSSQRREPSKPVDDALFLLDTKPAPAKPPTNKIIIIGGVIGLIIILAAVFFIGLPMLTGTSGFTTNSTATSAGITPIATVTTPVVKPTPASGALVPQPTVTVPADQKIYFHVQKDPITSKILVIFTGSAGAGGISSADVKVTHADGSVSSGVILPLKGVSEITLAGTKEPDRVEIIAKMSTGETYRVYDNLVTSQLRV